jgi:hypothetical protein
VTCKICLEALDKGYNFASNLISIWGFHSKLWVPKVARVSTLAILRLPFGSPRTKCRLDVGLMERHKLYYKGEGGGFPQLRIVVSFVSLNCMWFILAPKVLRLHITHLVFSFVQVHVSSWYVSFFLIPSRSSSTPLYPQSATSQGVCPNSLLVQCFQFKLTFESIKELGSASWKTHKVQRNNAPSKTFQKYVFGTKNLKIWSNFNHSKVLNY